MRHIKIIGLAAIAAMALMAVVASSASATELYSGATTLKAGTEIKATLSGTATLTTTENVTLDTCSGGEVVGKTSNTGSATETVKGMVKWEPKAEPATEDLKWSNCSFTTDTLEGGELEIHWIEKTINGTLTGKGFKVTINTGLFGSCIFTLGAGTTLGTLTGKTGAKEDAIMDINAVATRESGLCPATARWVGTYTVTSPTPLHVTGS